MQLNSTTVKTAIARVDKQLGKCLLRLYDDDIPVVFDSYGTCHIRLVARNSETQGYLLAYWEPIRDETKGNSVCFSYTLTYLDNCENNN